jgi:L-ribulokinase
MNGCRTPLMDGTLTGAFSGLTLRHTAGHLYRALLEASAFGLRWIVETMREGGLSISRFVATGGLPHHNPHIVQIYADVLGESISVHPCQYGPALGAAILGALAAGPEANHFASMSAAIESMAGRRANDPRRQSRMFKPVVEHQAAYEAAYKEYRTLAGRFAK